jgi:Rps23 Pro-64 3,4-dihydroxylase Tpa1-like proline 4-hydroxylase
MEKKIINEKDWLSLSQLFLESKPFNYVIIDNFFVEDFAHKIYNDMSDYDETVDVKYDNSIEKKRTIQSWTKFKKNVYKALTYLVTQEFTNNLKLLSQQKELMPDYGLHGAGIHMHKSGDYLNVHVDYDIHPKLEMKRKLNLIIYMNPNWQESWGGNIGLWTHDDEMMAPKDRVVSITPVFNRAVLFDTTQNSWHGVTEGITAPEGQYRKSLALYYLIPEKDVSNKRQKALFFPREEQKGDASVEHFIKMRSGLK